MVCFLRIFYIRHDVAGDTILVCFMLSVLGGFGLLLPQCTPILNSYTTHLGSNVCPDAGHENSLVSDAGGYAKDYQVLREYTLSLERF